MFVEATDFDGYPYSLPNLDKRPNTFSDFVDYVEENVLVDLLGRSFYDRLIAGLAEASPDQIWLNIRDGASYSYQGVDYKFGGLKKLLTPCVYSEFIRVDYEKYSGVGTVQPKSKNSVVVSPSRQIVKGWNDFVRLAGFLKDGSRYDPYYGEYYYSLSGCVASNENSLYGLLESNTAYGDYEYNFPGTINIFDL